MRWLASPIWALVALVRAIRDISETSIRTARGLLLILALALLFMIISSTFRA